MPITRPMWLGGPSAPGASTNAQQWMLGPDVLVAPVVTEGAAQVEVSFPRGCWQHQAPGGDRHHGPGTAVVSAPLGRLPYFFRCGERPFDAP
jgi:alpha-glucosidase (family GH31 glycosyl hydrolase)